MAYSKYFTDTETVDHHEADYSFQTCLPRAAGVREISWNSQCFKPMSSERANKHTCKESNSVKNVFDTLVKRTHPILSLFKTLLRGWNMIA